MKRVIKYYNKFRSNDLNFSDCGTEYEVLPILVEDSASNKELRKIAKDNGLEMIGNVKSLNKSITHSVKLNEVYKSHYRNEEFQYYLGFIKIDFEGHLSPVENLTGILTDGDCYDIVNNQTYGVDDVVNLNDTFTDDIMLVMSGWNYYHELKLLGYDNDNLEKLLNVDDRCFYDDIFRCDDCSLSDFNDSGYTYNYRMTDNHLQLGTNCGCYQKHCEENLEEFINNSDKAVESETIEKLVEDGYIEFVDDFCSRWGNEVLPDDILKRFKKESDSKFIFGIDSVGQFQTSYSIYKIIGE